MAAIAAPAMMIGQATVSQSSPPAQYQQLRAGSCEWRKNALRARLSTSPSAAASRKRGLVVFATQAPARPPSSSVVKAENGGPIDVVVVGGGVSGLCTAIALQTDHKDSVSSVLVTEARDRPGGNITSVTDGTYLWEEGPNSFQPNVPMMKMSVDVGLKDELVFGDPDAPRFVFWENRLRPVPAGLLDLPVFDLMSIPGKIRAGLGALGIRPGPPEGKEETVEQFVRRNLGDEVFFRLIEPFCSGVYAGDPTKLSMKAAFGKVQRLEDKGGSIIGGVLKLIQEKKDNPPPPPDPRLPKPKGQTVGSFKNGLITLPKAIAAKLGDRLKVNWVLRNIAKNADGTFTLAYETPDGWVDVISKSVVLTTPSYIASDIVRPLSPVAADALNSFYYPPVGAVTLAYPQSALREDRLTDGELKGFGQLHPRSQGITTLGTIYSSSLFPNRAPDGEVLLLNYIGGSLNPGIVDQTEDELVAQVDKDLRIMLLKPDAPKPKAVGVRVWPRAIPQFLVGHFDRLDKARNGLAAAGLDGLFLGGNYVGGVALGRCVEHAYESADEIAKFVGTKVTTSA